MITNFQELAISAELKQAIEKIGFTQMTEVQQKTIPVMMSGEDLVAKAPTGTGKTFAFGIGLLEGIDPDSDEVQGLVLAPTRELAIQITEELKKLCLYKRGVRMLTLYGGQPITAQITALKRRPQILVATPGRLIDHIKRKTLSINKVMTVVLDECDEMLDMGFLPDVKRIIEQTPAERQLVMFSATISRQVMDISWLYQRDPVEIEVAAKEESLPKITQYYAVASTSRQKTQDVIDIVKQFELTRVMIFCNTKTMTDILTDHLREQGLAAECLHGDIAQKIRNQTIMAFKAGDFDLLIATDVAARGIDVMDVEAVINYDLPQDNAFYLHRIGRTGRAQKEGVAISLVAEDELPRFKDLLRHTKSEVTELCRYATGDITLPEAL